MNIERHLPSDRLRPFVKNFTIIESECGMENRLLADTSIVIAFRFRGMVAATANGAQSNLPTAVISGLQKTPFFVRYSKHTTMLLVIFEEGGAAAFFKEPVHELFGMRLSLDNLVRRDKVSEVEERLAEATNNAARISIVEQFLLSQLKDHADRLVLNAIQKIKSAGGNLRIKELLSSLPISVDPFEKRFRRLVGASPKQFSAIVRFRNLIMNHSPSESLADTAHTAGYFDQAHFIKDFKSFTGQTPLDFFRSSSYW